MFSIAKKGLKMGFFALLLTLNGHKKIKWTKIKIQKNHEQNFDHWLLPPENWAYFDKQAKSLSTIHYVGKCHPQRKMDFFKIHQIELKLGS